MGIVPTYEWLDEDFADLQRISKRLLPYFTKDIDDRSLYRYLAEFGMYRPNRATWDGLVWLKEEKIWDRVGNLLRKYRKRWNGPDIDVFIFPKNSSTFFRSTGDNRKSGLSFPDKMFLSLSPIDDEGELEALFIHEYHHICRMSRQAKSLHEYTLLDSLVLEGCAEYTVSKLLGKKYRAYWCDSYSKEILEDCWYSFIKEHLSIKREHRLHDLILFGGRRYPKLIGYAAGYWLVDKYFQRFPFSEKTSLIVSSESILESFT